MEMLISFSSRTLAPAHSAKTTSKWFADNDITVLDWPANMPDLNPIHSKNCWVKNNPIWVILATQCWVKKGRTQRWVILTQQVGLLCLTQHAGLLFYGLKITTLLG